ncbi:hypothetical protein BU24DRAFT_162514 [Aaosphaeria arxii CBS 175.79]|uniref:Secreted protein n=1 Tax=Aaosphaeria arxii CBS 175.79 TaxID=1450172 RepID=A0A6A5XZ36_9PLEO|nr:uncharacterized protein BU24DRAFT_162514 [Aaosphaeria arxii CBS 175.79]KAF2017961.1 hypothetical protein BU24DRAFT_162514 [Aaosphaeria arxii CBS 175.79]
MQGPFALLFFPHTLSPLCASLCVCFRLCAYEYAAASISSHVVQTSAYPSHRQHETVQDSQLALPYRACLPSQSHLISILISSHLFHIPA